MTRKLNPILHSAVSCLLAASALIFTLSACGNPPEQTTTHIRETTATRPDTTVRHLGGAAYVALTLPVLDALFYEEGFEQELRSKLELSDEQINKLKSVSRESVADLSEEGAIDYAGSAREAAKRYEEKIRGILGDEKSVKLAQLVDQRYANGEVQGLMSTTPNAVPTDTRIVVNAPAYRMDVFREGYLVKSYRIGIGYPEFPLPAGMRRAETIIFNPSWTPPDEPWVKGKYSPGKKVEAGSKDNPLGLIKIPIGYPSLIHGGKAAAKLGSFASHGCVGLTNEQVQDFAINLAQLSGTALEAGDIKTYTSKKSETKSLALAQPVPVELRYETIVAEDGGLRVFRDVYERGTNTLETARRVLDAHSVSYDSLSAGEKTALLQALTEMNRDPQGNAIATDSSELAATAAGDPEAGRQDGVAPSKVAGAKKGTVTRSVVGKKEILVPIVALKGKGYPAPVNYHTGEKQPVKGKQAPASARR